MRKILLCIIVSALSLCAMAQDDNEYKMEIGVGAGMVAYEGDFNGNVTKNMQPMASLILRRVINPYMGLKLDLSYGKLKGSSAGLETWYPEYSDNPVEFSNTLIDLGITYEYNFWPYGLHHGYQGRQRITPYAQIGIGGAYGKAGKAFTFQVPVGVGVKYKLKPRLNIGLDFLYHFTLSDGLDGFKNPHAISSSGFKNKDHYCTTLLYITYEFSPKCVECNKD